MASNANDRDSEERQTRDSGRSSAGSEIGRRSLTEAIRKDLLIACMTPLVIFFVTWASDIDVMESFLAFAEENEEYELDEIPFVILLAFGGFSWFAWRQWHRFEAEVRRRLRLEREITDTRAMAHQADDDKADFMANLSHELRTPLNAIIGFSQLIEQEMHGPLDNKHYKDYLKTIHNSATMLHELIGDFLDLEKIEAGAEELNFKRRRMADIVEAVIPVIEPSLRSAEIELIQDFPPWLPRVYVDTSAMKKIVINLLTNAVKYNRPGGKVYISGACTDKGEFSLRVKDTGIGIDPNDLKKILQPFRRGESAEVKTREGIGLGLNIVARLVEMHDATIAFTSQPKVGTTVIVTLPRERVGKNVESMENEQAGARDSASRSSYVA